MHHFSGNVICCSHLLHKMIGDLVSKETVCCIGGKVALALRKTESEGRRIHSDEGLALETSVFESFTVANLPYQPFS